jgi:hypothetical protein
LKIEYLILNICKMPMRWLKIQTGAAIAILVLAVCITGCGPQKIKPLRICPGKTTVDAAIAALNSQSENVVPFKAAGDCTYFYDANGKKRKEQLRLMVRIEPPDKIYIQGGTIVGKTVILGSNEREFWLALMPKEISTYIWGDWNDEGVKQCIDSLWIGPGVWRDAFGIINISKDSEIVWELSHQGPFDILSQKNKSGTLRKRLYVYCCDYHIRKIEYFDRRGNQIALAEFENYSSVVKNNKWMVPRKLEISGPKQESISVELTDIGMARFTDKQRQILFERPIPTGFEHVEKMNSACEFVEQNLSK